MKKNNDHIIKYIFLFLVFYCGILVGLFFWDRIFLPFNNPWGVIGPLTVIKYNPTNNIVRFIVLILSPALLLSTIYLFKIKKINNICFRKNSFFSNNANRLPDLPSFNRTILSGILIVFSILFAIKISTYHASENFDSFHEGESLGTSISYIHGNLPYKDFLFCHGIYQDPLRSVIAFKIFGKSIGSVRTVESIVKIFAFVLLSIFMLKIYNKNYLFSITSLLILFFLHNIYYKLIFPNLPQYSFILILPREITTFSFLITITLLKDFIYHHAISSKKFFIITFLFSFIPLASFIYTIDRGFYLFSTYLIISPILYFFFFRKSIYRFNYLISSALGIILATVLLLIALRGNFFEFFKYTFLIMPKYKELLDGLVFPIHSNIHLLICILISVNVYWIIYKFIQEVHQNNTQISISITKFTEKYLIEFCLLLISIFFFRSALGRSDWEHVIYSSCITYILIILILFKHYLHKCFYNNIFTYSVAIIAVLISILLVYQIHSRSLLTENFPVNIADSKFIPDNYKATIYYLKNNLNNKENFFTMTSEASWYYFIDKPCPTRFPVVWFASPYFYQEEIIKDLKKNNVKFILYKNNYWSNTVNGFDNEVRFPKIINYIKQSYIFFIKIDDNEIWINKLYNK